MGGGRGGDPGDLRVPNRQQEAASRVSPATAPHEWELTKEKGTALSAGGGTLGALQGCLRTLCGTLWRDPFLAVRLQEAGAAMSWKQPGVVGSRGLEGHEL